MMKPIDIFSKNDQGRFRNVRAVLACNPIRMAMGELAYRCIYAFSYTLGLLPVAALYRAGSFLFFLAFHVLRYRRAVVVQNIARCFPAKRYGEVNKLVEHFYRCFTAYFVELIRSIAVPPKKIGQHMVLEQQELVMEWITSGRNVVACLGHCGNWELLNFLPQLIPCPVYGVYKPLRSKVIDQLMVRIRGRFGMQLIPDRGVVRHIQSKTSPAGLYLFLADQCPSRADERFRYEFFGQQTYFFSGMERLARKSGAAVVYLHVEQVSRGNYRIICLPICTDARELELGKVTAAYVKLLEDNISSQPQGWLWSHRRWKL